MGKAPDLPEPKIVRMPNRTDPSIREARLKGIFDGKKRGGRASTILSQAMQSINGAKGDLGA